MEFNELPEGFEGEQKRETEFDSSDSKLAYDTEQLIVTAKESLQVSGVENASGDQILMAIKLIVGAHRKDYNDTLDEALRGAIDVNLETDTATSPAVEATDASTTETSPAAPATTTPSKGPLILLSKSPHTSEHKKYLEATIGQALPSVRKAFANARIEIPTDSEILQAMTMTNRFTPEQIEALMRNIQVPGLVVLPPEMQSFESYVGFLNANKKRRRQDDVFTSDSRKKAFSEQDKALIEERKGQPAQYKFGIGEMTQEPQNRQGKLRDIVETWEGSDLAKLTRTVTPREYAVLQAQAKDILDLNGWTMLSEENASHKIIGDDNLVSGAYGRNPWYGDFRVNFRELYPEVGCDYARVRPVVVG
ncbi:MAG: hypothetical protein Q8P62_04055 [Candidatus Peregrinibacteria bacterium]|nr:hypothetical protein [Candidatus Peregrinibacteria bacterium]